MDEDITVNSKQLSLVFEYNKQLYNMKMKQRELKKIEFDIDTLDCAMKWLNHERIKSDSIAFSKFAKDIKKIRTSDISFTFY